MYSHCSVRIEEPSLYFNGYQISDRRVNYTIQSGTIVLNISNATSKDFGVYEVLTLFQCYSRFTRYYSYYYISMYNYLGTLYLLESYTVVKYGM